MHFRAALLAATAASPLLAAPVVSGDGLLPWDAWDHGRVALEDVSIHFRYAGSGPPLLLVHGNPQYSLTWQHIGPILAQNYTVIAPDNRGAGDSSIPSNGDYSAEASGDDLKAVLDFLNVTSAYVFSHDKGVGFAMALAAKHPSAVKRLGLSEYVLPGFGYQDAVVPGPFWDLYQNPQLAFFQIPDFAEFLMSGKEREFLLWYFYHGSYSGPDSMTEDTVNRYASAISKPGFLRAMLGPFSTASINADTKFFNETVGQSPLQMPVLAMGGESSFGVEGLIESLFGPLADNIEVDTVPKAGHWVADENPVWVAERVRQFFGKDNSTLPAADLSALKDKVTTKVGFYGTLRNARLGGLQV
jgi:pimeloyl-ACP methyl ester carboxylesterase